MINRFSRSSPDGPYLPSQIQPSFRSEMEQMYPLIQVHDEQAVDLGTAERLAVEAVNVTGAEIDVYIRTDNNNYDPVFEEDPNPTYWAPERMKALYPNAAIQQELTKWGADIKIPIKIFFAKAALQKKFGDRLLRHGDVLQLPFNDSLSKAVNFKVLSATPSGLWRYFWLYIECTCENLTGDVTVTPNAPDRLPRG